MSVHRFTLELEVDDEALREHNGDRKPPPNSLEDWNASDISDAAGLELVDLGESILIYEGRVSG